MLGAFCSVHCGSDFLYTQPLVLDASDAIVWKLRRKTLCCSAKGFGGLCPAEIGRVARCMPDFVMPTSDLAAYRYYSHMRPPVVCICLTC